MLEQRQPEGDHLVDGGRTHERGAGLVGTHPVDRHGVVGTSRVLEDVLDGGGSVAPVPLDQAQLHDEPPRIHQPGFIPDPLEQLDAGVDVRFGRPLMLATPRDVADVARLQPRPFREAVHAEGPRRGLGRREGVGRDLIHAGLEPDPAQVEEEPGPLGMVVRKQRDRPLQQVGRSRQVAATERPAARRSESGGCSDPELDPMVVEWPQLRSVAVGLFEVVAEDLLELGGAVRPAV